MQKLLRCGKIALRFHEIDLFSTRSSYMRYHIGAAVPKGGLESRNGFSGTLLSRKGGGGRGLMYFSSYSLGASDLMRDDLTLV